mgnify:CR=1 FL=1
MPTLQELNQKVTELQDAIDIEQQQVADLLAQKETAIAALTQANADLELLVADGGTAEERQAVLDKLNAAKADLESTVAP